MLNYMRYISSFQRIFEVCTLQQRWFVLVTPANNIVVSSHQATTLYFAFQDNWSIDQCSSWSCSTLPERDIVIQCLLEALWLLHWHNLIANGVDPDQSCAGWSGATWVTTQIGHIFSWRVTYTYVSLIFGPAQKYFARCYNNTCTIITSRDNVRSSDTGITPNNNAVFLIYMLALLYECPNVNDTGSLFS